MAFYVNVDGLTRQQAEQSLYQLMQEYAPLNLPEDVQENYYVEHVWLPIRQGQSRVELIYPGRFQLEEYDNVTNDEIDTLIDQLQKYKERLNG